MAFKTTLSFLFTKTTIKENLSLWVKTFGKTLLFSINWILTLMLKVLATPIWLPVVLWKTGLIVSDNIIKHITSD